MGTVRVAMDARTPAHARRDQQEEVVRVPSQHGRSVGMEFRNPESPAMTGIPCPVTAALRAARLSLPVEGGRCVAMGRGKGERNAMMGTSEGGMAALDAVSMSRSVETENGMKVKSAMMEIKRMGTVVACSVRGNRSCSENPSVGMGQ
jgi:hypothetical protein